MRFGFRLDKFHVMLAFKYNKYGELFNNFGQHPSCELEIKIGDDDNGTITRCTSDQITG